MTAIALAAPRRHLVGRALAYWRQFGARATLRRIGRALRPPPSVDYAGWVARYDTLSPADLGQIRARIDALPGRPLISVLLPTYDTDPELLRRAIDSVCDQLYPDWELCVVDDASTAPHVAAILRECRDRSPRIRLRLRSRNGGIAAASNDALALAGGDYVALLDHDDELAPHALYLVAEEILAHPDAVLIYSDEDKIDRAGNRHDPYFKPDWNPALLHGQNYISHLGVYRTELVRALGGFRPGYDGSQDYDLALRTARAGGPGRIRHIPHILYHWRIGEGGGNYSLTRRDKALDAARRALADHFRALGEPAEIVPAAPADSYHRVRRPIPEPPPRVTLIVPTRDRLDLLSTCVRGLLEETDYPALELVVVDNDSAEPATKRYLERLARDERVTVLHAPGAFHFSRLNNRAVAATAGELVGFVNNDIAVIEPGWLKAMVEELSCPRVGAVGAKLYYGNDTIQHAGVVLGIGGVAGHWEKATPRGAPGYFARLLLTQEVSCVTAACMLVRRTVFEAVGGFNEHALAVAFNDVDLCLKIREAGHAIVWTPHAELYHLESASRGYDLTAAKARRFQSEVAYMRSRWGAVLDRDPFHSPNLTLDSERFGFACPPRVRRPWQAA